MTVIAALVMVAAMVTIGFAAVTLIPTRGEALYSTDTNPDCSKLFGKKDDALPLNVVRIRAAVDNAPSGQVLRYQWSMPKKTAGTLAANLDLGPSDQTSAIDGMCADFGNVCLLTENRLRFYNESSILWIAPTCAVLPKNTSKPFAGGVGRVKLKVSAGSRRLGTATIGIPFGHNGAVTLFVSDFAGGFSDGVGKREVPSGFNAVFATRVTPPTFDTGPVTAFQIDNGGGASVSTSDRCRIDASFDACERLDYGSSGRFLASVAAKFGDGSALCDNLNVRVVTCSPNPKLEIIPRPKLSTYDPANPQRSVVDLTVRLHNASRAQGGLPPCPFLLRGANVLNCAEALKVGNVTDSKTTTFDLQHCSKTTDRACDTDADCRCNTCEAGETCLTGPHCSKTLTQACGNDADCSNTGQPPACGQCQNDETCIRVLTLGQGGELQLDPGRSVDLLHQTVTLRNEFPNTAKMTDTWTATTENAGSADATFKYRIRGRPK